MKMTDTRVYDQLNCPDARHHDLRPGLRNSAPACAAKQCLTSISAASSAATNALNRATAYAYNAANQRTLVIEVRPHTRIFVALGWNPVKMGG